MRWIFIKNEQELKGAMVIFKDKYDISFKQDEEIYISVLYKNLFIKARIVDNLTQYEFLEMILNSYYGSFSMMYDY